MELTVFLRDAGVALLQNTITMAPFSLPPALLLVFWSVWVPYTRAKFLAAQKYVLLEVRVPREQPKSPLAMEVVLNALYSTFGESTWYDRYLLGKTRQTFSLELVSIDGHIRFFIYTRVGAAKTIETQIYSQYPNAEVREVEDYTPGVPYAREGGGWRMFGLEFTLAKPSPYPLLTYVDYNLERDPKEELKVDPMTPMLEYLGGIGRGEQIWVQIHVRASKGKKDPTPLFGRAEDWQEKGKEAVEEIIKLAKGRSGELPEDKEDMRFSMLTEGERTIIKAIERKIGKLGFDCGMRAMYLAKEPVFNPANIGGLFGLVRAYNTNNLNSLSPLVHTEFDFPWQHHIGIPFLGLRAMGVPFFSPRGRRLAYFKWTIFDAYRKRSWFFPPHQRKPFVLNTEELASLYHFPGRVAETPAFERIESRRAEPPTNLPT